MGNRQYDKCPKILKCTRSFKAFRVVKLNNTTNSDEFELRLPQRVYFFYALYTLNCLYPKRGMGGGGFSPSLKSSVDLKVFFMNKNQFYGNPTNVLYLFWGRIDLIFVNYVLIIAINLIHNLDVNESKYYSPMVNTRV